MRTYKVIQGTFHVKGYAPDGDSIRFQAKNNEHWDFFSWRSKTERKRKKKQLRIEAIDALETHYRGARQPHAFGVAALERMLQMFGITGVEYNLLVTRIDEASDGVEGFIATADLDIFHRPICFAFPDFAPLNDGELLVAEQLPLEESINYRLLSAGLVYPTFYSTLESEIRNPFRMMVKEAKFYRRGIWAIDKTAGFRLWNTRTVQEDVIIFPKFFRRFISFFEHRSRMEEFMDFLSDNRDPILLENGKLTFLHELIEKKENYYGLKVAVEDMMFLPG